MSACSFTPTFNIPEDDYQIFPKSSLPLGNSHPYGGQVTVIVFLFSDIIRIQEKLSAFLLFGVFFCKKIVMTIAAGFALVMASRTTKSAPSPKIHKYFRF